MILVLLLGMKGVDVDAFAVFSVMRASCRQTKEWYEEKNDQRR